MTSQTITLLGFTVAAPVITNYEDFQEVAGDSEKEAWAKVSNHATYHSFSPSVRRQFCAAVNEAMPDFAWPKAADGKTAVSEALFIEAAEKVWNDTNDTDFREHFQPVLDDIASKTKLSFKTRGGGPSKAMKDLAQSYLDAIEAGESTIERVVTNLRNRNDGLSISDEPTLEELAEALTIDDKRTAAERKAGVLG